MDERPATIRIEPNPKWVRGMLGSDAVVDSRRSRFVWEHRYYPLWYFPSDAVRGELVVNGVERDTSNRGRAIGHDLVVGERTVPGAAWRHPEAPDDELRSLVKFEWNALDRWFEEEVEVFVHPRSPEVRIDALPSRRRVLVRIDGHVVADSDRPTLLFETGLPPRYYLPKTDVRMDLLTPTDTTTACPYKGFAQYWSATVDGRRHDDVAWGYVTPLPESEAVAGMVCFYDERVDIEVDGVAAGRPETPFS